MSFVTINVLSLKYLDKSQEDFIYYLLIFFLVTFELCCPARASITLQSNHSAHLDLIAPSCLVLDEQKVLFCDFKEKIDELMIDPQTIKCLPLKPHFKINVSSCLPKFVTEVQNKKLFTNGANCWGTVLHLQGLSQKPKFTWPLEFQYWLESPLCRKLNPFEKIEANDILNVYGPEKLDAFERELKDADYFFWEALFPNRFLKPIDMSGSGYTGFHRLLHSVVMTSESIVFGKDSPSNLDRYYFHQLSAVYGRTSDVDCQENQTFEPYTREGSRVPKRIKNTKCDYFTNVYRCQNLRDYFSNLELTSDEKEIHASVTQLDDVLKYLFKAELNSNFKLSSSERKSLGALALTNSQEALRLLKTGPSKNKEMLLVKQYFFSQSILNQLKIIK